MRSSAVLSRACSVWRASLDPRINEETKGRAGGNDFLHRLRHRQKRSTRYDSEHFFWKGMNRMENKRTHLQMLQGVINRLAGNSFLIKGWSVTLVAALFALAAKDAKLAFVYLAYFPVCTFWLLDGYFLHQERLFRKLYDRVRNRDEPAIDFAMDTSVVSGEVPSWRDTAFSKTLLIFHGTLLGAVVIVMIILILIA